MKIKIYRYLLTHLCICFTTFTMETFDLLDSQNSKKQYIIKLKQSIKMMESLEINKKKKFKKN